MEKVSATFNNITNLMDQNIRGVQISCYSVALVGLTVALRRVRPFSKFKRPADVPNNFIAERRELSGLVRRIEPDGGLLMIQHKPLVNIPLVSSGELPVKISGIQVTSLGLNWLQAIVAGKEVKFVPVAKDKQFLQCQVMLIESTKSKKPRLLNVGEHLVKIGFGSMEPIHPPLSQDPAFLTYYSRLKVAEKQWLRKQLGLRYYVKPTRETLETLARQLFLLSIAVYTNTLKGLAKIPRIYVS